MLCQRLFLPSTLSKKISCDSTSKFHSRCIWDFHPINILVQKNAYDKDNFLMNCKMCSFSNTHWFICFIVPDVQCDQVHVCCISSFSEFRLPCLHGNTTKYYSRACFYVGVVYLTMQVFYYSFCMLMQCSDKQSWNIFIYTSGCVWHCV